MKSTVVLRKSLLHRYQITRRFDPADFDAERVTRSGLTFEYYGADVHRAAFVLPAFQRRDLGDLLTPFKRKPDM